MNLSDNGLQKVPLLLSITVLIVLGFGFMMSNSEVLAQSPDFNFSDFNFSNITGNSGGDLSSLSSLLSSFKMVNGTYNNPDFGFEIVFPEAWQGSEVTAPSGKVVFVSSPDLSPDLSSVGSMIVSFLDNRNNEALSTISNLTNPLGDSPSGSGGAREPTCKPISFSPNTVNGIKAEEIDLQCEADPEMGLNGSLKAKYFTIATNDNSLVSIGLFASPDIYDRELPKFEESVKTIKLLNPGDVSISPTYSALKKLFNQQQSK